MPEIEALLTTTFPNVHSSPFSLHDDYTIHTDAIEIPIHSVNATIEQFLKHHFAGSDEIMSTIRIDVKHGDSSCFLRTASLDQ